MGLPIIAAIAKAHRAGLTVSPASSVARHHVPRLHPSKTGKMALVPA
jgi:hypothetical protein